MNNSFLTHYGVLGMRWGKRRGSNDTETHADKIVARHLGRKKIDELSNEELKVLATRLQLERQYKDLKSQNVSAGKKFVTEILTNAGKEAVKNYVAKQMGKGIEVAVGLVIKKIRNK